MADITEESIVERIKRTDEVLYNRLHRYAEDMLQRYPQDKLDVEQLADVLGVCAKTVRRKRAAGEAPHSTQAKKYAPIRFPRAAIIDHLIGDMVTEG